MEEANYLLGYSYFLTGPVLHGNEIGRTIGIPTANQRPEEFKLLPPKGVYAVEILAEGKCDYLGFSYYMTNAVKADVQKDTAESLDGSSPNSIANPYVKASDWGWQIDPVGLRYALVLYMNVMKYLYL